MSNQRIALLLICFAVIVGAWALLQKRQAEEWGRDTPSSYSPGPLGSKALFLLLEELRLPVVRYRRPFSRLRGNSGVVVMTTPNAVPYGRREMMKLEEWLKKGNRLVIFEGTYRSSLADRDASTRAPKKRRRSYGGGVIGSPSAHFGLRLSESADTSRKAVEVPLPFTDAFVKISVSSAGRWSKTYKGWSTLADDEAGSIVVSKKIGKGEVVAVSDSTLVSNADLRHEQNLRLILGLLLDGERPKGILFDEFHHGHEIEESFWSFVAASIFAVILVQLSFGLALFFYSKRARCSGRYRSLELPVGRSSLEYVDSMAGIFESCKAEAVALDAVVRRFLRQVSQRAGVPLSRLTDDSLDKLAVVPVEKRAELGDLIRQSRAAVGAGVTPDRAVSLAQRVAAFKHEINGVRVWKAYRPSTTR